MNRHMHEEYYNDPELFRRLAHRERARAINASIRWLFDSIGTLLSAAKASLTPRPRPSHWLARLG